MKVALRYWEQMPIWLQWVLCGPVLILTLLFPFMIVILGSVVLFDAGPIDMRILGQHIGMLFLVPMLLTGKYVIPSGGSFFYGFVSFALCLLFIGEIYNLASNSNGGVQYNFIPAFCTLICLSISYLNYGKRKVVFGFGQGITVEFGSRFLFFVGGICMFIVFIGFTD